MEPVSSKLYSTVDPQLKVKRGPPSRLALGPDAAAVAVDDALDDGQANAMAFELLLGVQALEGAEELAGSFPGEADPIVPDEDGAIGGGANFDLSRMAVAAELDRVADQVVKHLLQQGGISPDGRQVTDVKRHFLTAGGDGHFDGPFH